MKIPIGKEYTISLSWVVLYFLTAGMKYLGASDIVNIIMFSRAFKRIDLIIKGFTWDKKKW